MDLFLLATPLICVVLEDWSEHAFSNNAPDNKNNNLHFIT
jgi:hypothetical protein